MRFVVAAFLLSFAVAAAVSCSRCAPERATRLWTYPYPAYFSGSDFAYGVFGTEQILLSKCPASVPHGQPLRALDTRTGRVLWELGPVDWVLHPPATMTPLHVVRRVPSEDVLSEPLELLAIDPASGAVLHRVALTRAGAPVSGFGARFFWAAGRVYGFTAERLSAHDPKTGAVLWDAPIDADPLWEPLVLADRVVFVGATYSAHALDDGRLLFRFEGACCDALATADGRHLYVRAAPGQTAAIRPDGALVHVLPGNPRAVSERHVATETDTSAHVFPHGAKEPVTTIAVEGEDEYVTAIALDGGSVYYFSSADGTVWREEIDGGERTAIHGAGGRLVISPDATGVAPAFVGTPPAIAHPYVFVEDWGITAYRLP